MATIAQTGLTFTFFQPLKKFRNAVEIDLERATHLYQQIQRHGSNQHDELLSLIGAIETQLQRVVFLVDEAQKLEKTIRNDRPSYRPPSSRKDM